MLCYRCGSHVPDSSERCENCGQQLVAGSARRASGAFQRRRAGQVVEGAPYRTGDLIAGRYEVKEIAGAGPVGFLFKARDKELSVEVAVKVVNARLVQTIEERESFARAIRLGRKLSHQNLARVNDDGEERGYPFYTTPFLDGLSLRKIVDLRQSKGQVFALQEVEPILGQIVAGLTSAHKVGPHANLKPENIIVLPDLLKITDFGLGAALPRAPFVQAQRTRKVDVYFAPEFLKGAKPDPRMDVYALGVILGEMLTGLVPDEQHPVPELVRKRPELPLPLEGLYRKALNENPAARFQTPAELLQEFGALLSGAKITKPERADKPEPLPPPVPDAAPKPPVPTVNFRRTGERTTVPQTPAAKADGSMEEPPAPDATQPLDASLLPFLGEGAVPGKPADATQPLDASLLPFAIEALEAAARVKLTPVPLDMSGPTPTASLRAPRGDADTEPVERIRPGVPAAITEPVDRVKPAVPNADNAPTMALDSAALPLPTGEVRAQRGSAVLWLALLTVGGAALGAVGGYGALALAGRGPPVPVTGELIAEEASAGGAGAGCPVGMVLIPAGEFKMGTAADDAIVGLDERKLAVVDVPAFCIDVYEFPNQAGVRPQANVSWREAAELCQAKGRRLCTEQEWEKSCKGPEGKRFPYGDTFDAAACNTQDADHMDRELIESGRFERCRSGYGVMDLSGNVAEWTSTSYAAGNAEMTQKGGAYDRTDYAARCSARRKGSQTFKSAQVGFRCCLDAPR